MPPHAQYQKQGKTWYIYFPYCLSINGKREQEHDYIGTLSSEGREFRPNFYYVQNEPDFEYCPLERWKNPTMRQRALKKLNANKVESIAPDLVLDPEIDCDQQLSVGATAICASILYSSGMLENVGVVLDNKPELTMACVNLAMHSVITTDKTYLADKESTHKLMFQHLLSSTCVYSSAALDGLLMTAFVGLSIQTYLRTKMNGTIPNELARNPEHVSAINNLWTIQEMLKDLRRIKLAYSKRGKPRLLNVVKRDRDLAEALGFPGLFDSAENVAKLLLGSHLMETLKK